MNRIVHGHEVEGLGRLRGVRVPAVEQHGHVVVPVQEEQGALARDDEEGVDELGDLGEDEQLDPEAAGAITEADLGVLAEVLLEAVVERG